MSKPVNPNCNPPDHVYDVEEEADDVGAGTALFHGTTEFGVMIALVSKFPNQNVLHLVYSHPGLPVTAPGSQKKKKILIKKSIYLS